jgi:hypothetical protein
LIALAGAHASEAVLASPASDPARFPGRCPWVRRTVQVSTRKHSLWRVPRSPATLCDRHVSSPPAFDGSPNQGVPPQRHDYATASALPADPVPPAEHHRPQVEERSGRAYGAAGPRFCPLGQNFAESPQLRLALAMLDASASALQAKWGHGVGRHARQMRGEIVSTCKELPVRSKSSRVQTDMYRRLYPVRRDFPFQREHILVLCERYIEIY